MAETVSASFRTPISNRTDSGEVFRLALKWISDCKCVNHEPRWHPTRLIDLSALKSEAYGRAFRSNYTGKPGVSFEDFEVKLVEKNDVRMNLQLRGYHYVTLSHRWGEAPQTLKLESDTLETFKKGLKLRELPQTFRDAIEFAARLHKIWYIWIDSLCIIQDSDNDWLKESALMHQVYSESYLNISATAAENSDEGIYWNRTPKLLWEDEVNLNIEGLPGSKVENSKSQGHELSAHPVVILPSKRFFATRSFSFKWPPSSPFRKLLRKRRTKTMPVQSEPVARIDLGAEERIVSLTEHQYIRRCTLVDASLWETLVNQASVNRRGWVLQERLLAPRVLHFCAGQIAWECSEFDAAEGLPPGVPNFQTRRDDVIAEIQVKGLDPWNHGKALRENRLQGANEPDPHLFVSKRDAKVIYSFEIWSRIVEIYSKTHLTCDKDKLIAISGIAIKMSSLIECNFVAGLWWRYLASQLLWRVEPVFNPKNRTFTHPSSRPEAYRAPSFSWASVNAQNGNGITYGEVTDKDILIDIVDVHPKQKAEQVGLVSEGHIELWGKLRKIELRRSINGRHCWYLKDRKIDNPGINLRKLHEETHTNVYLDCPSKDDVFSQPESRSPRDDTYCLPVSRGERVEIDESKYLFCLLLQLVPKGDRQFMGPGTFRRIGMTKLSPWADKLAHEYILEHSPADVELPHQDSKESGYRDTGEHRICII